MVFVRQIEVGSKGRKRKLFGRLRFDFPSYATPPSLRPDDKNRTSCASLDDVSKL